MAAKKRATEFDRAIPAEIALAETCRVILAHDDQHTFLTDRDGTFKMEIEGRLV